MLVSQPRFDNLTPGIIDSDPLDSGENLQLHTQTVARGYMSGFLLILLNTVDENSSRTWNI